MIPQARRCTTCGVTAKGAWSERACVAPSGTVHLRDRQGITFCGKRPAATWRLGGWAVSP